MTPWRDRCRSVVDASHNQPKTQDIALGDSTANRHLRWKITSIRNLIERFLITNRQTSMAMEIASSYARSNRWFIASITFERSKNTMSTFYLSLTRHGKSSWVQNRFVRDDILGGNPCWASMRSWFLVWCFWMLSLRKCSMILQAIEIKPTGL